MATGRNVARLRRAHFEETRQLRGDTHVEGPMISIDCKERLGKFAVDAAHTGTLSCGWCEIGWQNTLEMLDYGCGNVETCRLL